jgi:hypothetical protein
MGCRVAAFIIVFSGYLAFTGLDRTYFWDDEAQTAIPAKNFLSTGKLSGWDGRNLYAYRNGVFLNRDLSPSAPHLQMLVAILSFRLLGISTWAGRFPFVLAGLASLIVFAKVLRDDYGADSWLWVYALGVLAFSVNFLLHIRQCRYYALSLLFALTTYYAYQRCLRYRRTGWFIFLAVSALLLFFSQYLIGGAFLLSLCILHFTFHRSEWSPRDWAKGALAVGLFVFVSLPYIYTNQVWSPHMSDRLPFKPGLYQKLTLLWWHIRDINAISALPWAAVVLLALLVLLRRERNLLRTCLEWATLGLGSVLVISLLSLQLINAPSVVEVRYLVAALPFFAGLNGTLLWLVHQWKKPAAVFLFLLMVCSNVFTLHPFNTRLRWPLPDYVQEVHNEYPTAASAVSDYLRQNAEQDDLVVAYPSHFNWPLMFYVGDMVKLCCFLDKRSPFSKDDLRDLNAPLFKDDNYPDWVVLFGGWQDRLDFMLTFSRPHREGRHQVAYDYQLARQIDLYWKQTQRPELPWHSFGPRTDFDQQWEKVYIYRRRGRKLLAPYGS